MSTSSLTATPGSRPANSGQQERWRTLRRFLSNRLATTGAVIILFLIFLAIFGEQLAPHDPNAIDMAARIQPPSAAHPFGTDDFGRDVLSRVMVGARGRCWSV